MPPGEVTQPLKGRAWRFAAPNLFELRANSILLTRNRLLERQSLRSSVNLHPVVRSRTFGGLSENDDEPCIGKVPVHTLRDERMKQVGGR